MRAGLILPLILTALLLPACHQTPASARVPNSQLPSAHAVKATPIRQATVTEAHQILATTPGVQFIDVRTPAEYAAGHAVGAVNMPLDQLPTWAPTLKADKPLVVICRSGSRSAQACSALSQRDFKTLTNVTGGTLDWEAKGLPMAK